MMKIDLAACAFGSLRDCLFSSPRICLKAKSIVFEGLILSILLYGAECWSLTEKCMWKIRVFVARCIRNMFRVTRKHTREYHISNEELRTRAGLLMAYALCDAPSTALGGSCLANGMEQAVEEDSIAMGATQAFGRST